MENFVLRDVHIYNANEEIEHAYITVKNGKITAVGENDRMEIEIPDMDRWKLKEYTVESGTLLVPGMIDVHIHGVNNADVMDGTFDALTTMTQTLPAEGTTSFLATTITQSQDAITRALQNAAVFSKYQAPQQAEMLGVHLEGPFFTPMKAGAQPKNFLLDADVSLFQEWQEAAEGLIKWVSLAPECDLDYQLIRHLKKTGVIASAAHSNANLEEVEQSIVAGLSHVTHLFNGMSGLHHREPGLASAALLHHKVTNEIIADGIHVHPSMVKMAHQMKGTTDIFLITDSIRAKCLPNGHYDLGGQTVTVEGNRPYLEDGTIAGSMLKMNEAMKNMMSYTDCSLKEAVAMTSANAAAKLGLEHKGAIAPGMDADFVLLDENQEVIRTWCRGQIAYEK
ncbi:N-acetylglucosamine-6-phosphate deacetylase [Salibacterium salarium]|uniref:N-acetylglucosamine-6-phosphate deacetylase n=1 Tax=Salibacterium salarium TaxID=284579 RepID=UPI002789F9C0|nr:N-acetylglucosamine-6-phosphate deacetylase [Salibacterium salarium]MDQ0298060.1 N-acetylglucosamine-6-phosphate deacetylase [Salibacterium salarium]